MQKKSIATVSAICLLGNIAHAQPTTTVLTLQPDAVVTLPTGAGLAAVAMGDFNHDNLQDIAVCERSLGQVALYLRSATGTYPSPAFTYAVGLSPSGLVSFNRTPNAVHYDLMALSGPSSQWTMLRDDNDPSGNLTRRVLTPAFGTGTPSPRPQLLQVDWDLNGVPDFAYTYPVYFNSFTQCSSYYNDTYAPHLPTTQYDAPYFNTPQNASSSITMADFDLNGRLDQALPDSAHDKVHFGGQFSGEITVVQNTGTGPVHVAAQDIDGDQLADVAIAYSTSNEVMVLRTTTTFGFNRGYSYQLSVSPRRVLLADLNRDGRPELLVVTASNELLLYRHNGLNTALCYSTYPPQVVATGVNPLTLQTAFLDSDLYPDIVVGCGGDNTVHTYLTRLNQVTATAAGSPLAEVAVYPTRATDQVNIQQPGAGRLAATLVDEVGRVVGHWELAQARATLAVGELPRGLYCLRLTGSAGTKTTRLVLQ